MLATKITNDAEAGCRELRLDGVSIPAKRLGLMLACWRAASLDIHSTGHRRISVMFCQWIRSRLTSTSVDVAAWAASPDIAVAWVNRPLPGGAVNVGYRKCRRSVDLHFTLVCYRGQPMERVLMHRMLVQRRL